MIEQAKKTLERLAHFGGIVFRRLIHASVEETPSIGYTGRIGAPTRCKQ
jgi:hypothetical protein